MKKPNDRGRVVEIHDPGAAGRERDQQPRRVLEGLADGLAGGERLPVEAHARHPVALDQPLHPEEQVGPDGLRAGEAAPDAAEQGGRQEQAEGRENQHAG